MKKLFKAVVYLFAVVGVLVSAGVGYIVGTNSDLVPAFMGVKDDFAQVPVERRKEVVAELPARIKFEREVRDDMAVLPAERQQALYDQLGKSRDAVFEGFKKRTAEEAKIAREIKDKEEALKKIKALPEVSVKVNMTDKPEPAPKADVLAGVRSALKEVVTAMDGYFKAKESNNPKGLRSAAVTALRALDKLGDKVVGVDKKSLGSDEKSDLESICTDALVKLKTAKETPGLIDEPQAKPSFTSIGPKLTAE